MNGTGVAESEVSTGGADSIVVAVPGKQRRATSSTRSGDRAAAVPAVGCGRPGRRRPPPRQPSGDADGTGPGRGQRRRAATAASVPARRHAERAAGDGADNRRPGRCPARHRRRPNAGGPDADRRPPTGPDATERRRPRPPARHRAAPDSSVPRGSPGAEQRISSSSTAPAPGLQRCRQDRAALRRRQPDEAARHLSDDGGAKYILGPADIEGTERPGANAGLAQPARACRPAAGSSPGVRRRGRREVRDGDPGVCTPSRRPNQFAIVLDGLVLSAPVVNAADPDGQAEISGNFTQDDGDRPGQLAEVRRAAADLRPGRRSARSRPTLGGEQLRAGAARRPDRPGPGRHLLPRLLPRPRAW